MTNVSYETHSDYLTKCARIRNICMTALVRELMTVIDRDQLVGAILDDEGKHIRERYQHRYTVKHHHQNP